MIKAAGPYGVTKYAYDPVGNRKSRELKGEVETYTYQPGTNRLKEISGPEPIRFEYDQAGQMVSKNEMSLGYDPLGRLVKAEVGGQVFEYIYNANNQRVIKICGENITVFHYDQAGLLIAETDEFGNTLREYVYLDNELISIIDPSEKGYHVHTNHRQEPQSVTDEHGNVVWQSCSTPFGRAKVDEDPGNTGRPFHLNIRLPGQYFDQETGLHYNWHRFYDPRIGRYISPDPIGLDGGDVNLYAYVGGNPVNRIDPMGLWVYKADCAYGSRSHPFIPLGGGLIACWVETECYEKKLDTGSRVKEMEEGLVIAVIGGPGFGSPIGGVQFEAELTEQMPGMQPSLSAMNGAASLMGAGVATPFGGGSISEFRLGDTVSKSISRQTGIDLGVDAYIGVSFVAWRRNKKC